MRPQTSIGLSLAFIVTVMSAAPTGLTQTRNGPSPALSASEPNADTYMSFLKFLASDDLEGRGNGTPGLDRAAEYIADRFREYGLEPGGIDRTYFQPFELSTGFRAAPGSHLLFRGPQASAKLDLERHYYPLSVISNGADSARNSLPVTFAGYGITAADRDYDDYAGVNVQGHAVLVFTHEPQEDDPSSRFNGKADTLHATVMNKAMVARSKGAALLIVVQDPNHERDDGRIGKFYSDPQAEEYGIPVVLVARDMLGQVLAGTLDLKEIYSRIDRTGQPSSRELGAITLAVEHKFEKIRRPVRNVVAIRRGSDPQLAREAIVLGAHYDHLGLGGRHSLSPDLVGQVHNGADDNASGTAAVLELARVIGRGNVKLPRTMVFVAFAGEELGLHGSNQYVNQPAVPLDQTIAMINLDMIGRPEGRIFISGLDTAPTFREHVLEAGKQAGLDVRTFGSGAGVGASDDTSFSNRRIPALGFFSGFHADYHRPTDDSDRIDTSGAIKVVRMTLALTQRVAALATRPEFVPAPAAGHATAGTPGPSAGTGGYGAYFGSVPDFAEVEKGVRFADVRPESPAALAGLRAGDILISFDGKPIANLYDFTFALRSKRPGEKVDVIVLREGKELRVTVELTQRR